MMNGIIICGRGGLYEAQDDAGQTYTLRAMKKLRRGGMSILVGDRVAFSPGAGEEHGWVEEILPRRSVTVRPPAANMTLLALVAAPEPEPDWLLMDKLLIGARRQGLAPMLIINKCDMNHSAYDFAKSTYRHAGIRVLACSAKTGEGLDALKAALAGELTCVAGQSGVGKSTLLGALLGQTLEVGDISKRILRGKNTTRHAQILTGNGLTVLDTPGFSLLDACDDTIDPVLLKDAYPDFAPYEGLCRFTPCYHRSEPNCAVLAAVKAGELDEGRVARYHTLLEEVTRQWRERYD